VVVLHDELMLFCDVASFEAYKPGLVPPARHLARVTLCRGGARVTGGRGIGLLTVSEATSEQSADLRRRRVCSAFAGATVSRSPLVERDGTGWDGMGLSTAPQGRANGAHPPRR